uniref:Uncharacterized protein n=1 Tax=Oryza meridionalis TaxID=40149 RepID=A0A0E0E5U6_9ORYZ
MGPTFATDLWAPGPLFSYRLVDPDPFLASLPCGPHSSPLFPPHTTQEPNHVKPLPIFAANSGFPLATPHAAAAAEEQRKMVEHLFEDIFTVTRLDPDGKKFDRVSRIEARSEQFDMYMQLDVATEVYPMRAGDRFTMVLAPTLNLDGTPDTGFYTQAGRKTLADKFDYVMHGKLYKISEDSSSGQATKVEIYASFGGLLMMLKGDPSSAASFELDQRLFLLIRKKGSRTIAKKHKEIGDGWSTVS